jgi:hypothetical protein
LFFMAQSPSAAQVVLHALVAVSHANGAQSTGGGDLQLPAMHVEAVLSRSLPVHDAAPHNVPSAIGEQVPCLPAIAHDWQAPHDAAPQQKPSVQNPLMHSPAAAQAVPFGLRFVHEYPWQV